MGLLIEFAVIAIALWVVWRGFSQHSRRVGAAVRKAEQAVRDATPETLVRDPKTGVYRPLDRPK
jgi:hypothetical protein